MILFKQRILMIMAVFILAAFSCTMPSGFFEKNVVIPNQQWANSYRPTIDFTIAAQDTGVLYNVYMVLRHTDAYKWNNLWVKGTVRQPGDSVVRSEKYDLPLATNQGWLGAGMDDIYEHRVLIQPQTKFSRPGTYSFTLEQIMREDPLKNILNVGLRVEKVQGL
jgi:gliding motility-associated lipoprotein GldH